MDLDYSIGAALGTDYFGLREPFTAQREGYLVRTREFVDAEVLPVINGYWERAEFPWALIEKMSPLGIVGAGIEGYGCPPMDPLSAGLIDMEINRGDGSLGTFLAVQAGLAMKAIARCGGVGAGHLGRRGEGVPGREGNCWLHRQGDDG
jgi:glutaryl-CoA dehydrogenase